MADPFSIIAGSFGLADVLFRLGRAVKRVNESAGRIDEDIAELSLDIELLERLNDSVLQTFEKEKLRQQNKAEPNIEKIDELWRYVHTLLEDCQKTLLALVDIVDEMIGPENPAKAPGKMDAIKKTLRKDKKMSGFKERREKISNSQRSLQLVLQSLAISYQQSSHESIDLSLVHLSSEVKQLSAVLQKQKDSALDPQSCDDAIKIAGAVAKMASINQHFAIPQTVSSIFTGRKRLLEDLQDAFDVFQRSPVPSNVQKRFIVSGPGGAGKTQFCCKFAQDNQDQFWGIFYVDASTPENAEISFSRIVKLAGIASSEGSNKRAAQDWLAAQDKPWLLLIDNADDPSPEADVSQYFPDGKRGSILVTTRIPGNKVHGTVGSQGYHFEQLHPDEANDLLLKAAAKPSRDKQTTSLASRIAKILGFLPLALIQAGTAIRHGLCRLASYEIDLQKAWNRIRKARVRGKSESKEKEEDLYTYSSYEINLKSLEDSPDESHIDAVQLLKMFSCFHHENIRMDVLMKAATNPRLEEEYYRKDLEEQMRSKVVERAKTAAEHLKDRAFSVMEYVLRDRTPSVLPNALRETKPLSEFMENLESRLRRALKHLTDMSLIMRHENGTSDTYSMHPLWHRWVLQRPDMRLAEQALWCQAAKTTLAQCIILPPNASEEPEQAMRRSLLPHVNHVRRCQAEIDIKIRENKESQGSSLTAALKGLLVSNSAGQKPMRQREALELAKFSRVYMECTFWKEAETLQLKVKEFVVEKLGADHPRAMGISLFLAATYGVQTRANEAAELQEHVLRVYERSLGPDHPRTLKMMDTLGSTRTFQGRFKDSLSLHVTAVNAMEKHLKSKYEDVLLQIDDASQGMERIHRTGLEEALAPIQESVKLMVGGTPTNPEDLFIAWGNLGKVLWRYFRYDEARKFYKKSLLGLMALLKWADSRIQDTLQDLTMSYLSFDGQVLGSEEILDDALTMQEEVFKQRKIALGEESPLTLLALGNIARIQSSLGNHEEAEAAFLKILPIAQRTLGEFHFGTLAGKAHYSNVLIRQKRYDEAEKKLLNIVQREKYKSAARTDGNHPDHITALWFLVRCCELHGKTKEALLHAEDLDHALKTIGGAGLGTEHAFSKMLEAKMEELRKRLKEDMSENSNPVRSDSVTSVTSTDTLPAYTA